MSNHPRWFFIATFHDGSTVTFYGDNLALAFDHARVLEYDFKRVLMSVKRQKHSKDVTPSEHAAAGTLYPATHKQQEQ